MQSFVVSIVIPVYNEEDSIQPLMLALQPILAKYQYEILFINDGSRDGTVVQIEQYCQKDPRVKLITLSRNFGHQYALSAGYQYATGDCVISMDADLQDPPDIIPEMISKWQDGARIVYAQRSKRNVDSLFKRVTAHGFYKLINFLSDVPIPFDVGDFRLLDRIVVTLLNDLPEHTRFLRGLVAWSGYPAAYATYERQSRLHGDTHYPLTKMLSFAFHGITSFTGKPLRLASYAGFTTAILGFLGIIYAVVGRLFFESYWVTGWTALFVGIMFLGGVQLITIGIVGEYIDRIYTEIQRRPMYVVQRTVNL